MLFLDFNSFSAKGNIEFFANNTDSGESARVTSCLTRNQHCLRFTHENSPKLLIHEKWIRLILIMEESTLNNSALKELNETGTCDADLGLCSLQHPQCMLSCDMAVNSVYSKFQTRLQQSSSFTYIVANGENAHHEEISPFVTVFSTLFNN